MARLGVRERRDRGNRAMALALLGTLSTLGAGCVDPVDVIVYAERLPSFFRISSNASPQPFENPFVDRKFLAGHPETRILVKPTPGLRLPEGGDFAWGHVSWGKYVVSGYHGADGVEDQRVGVFDTETHAFCELDLDPSLHGTASVGWLRVAAPQARQTRIYFQGLGSVGYAFGYIEADLDTAHPCDPVTGWSVVGYSGADLNCRAVGLPLGCTWDQVCATAGQPPGCIPAVDVPPDLVPCPDVPLPIIGFCAWDGMDTLDAQTVILHNHISALLVVLQVDEAGVLTMPDAYRTPKYQPPGADCYLWPVNHPVVDRTRPAGDRRWTSVFDLPGIAGCTPTGGKPAQEFRFDGSTITPTSPLFTPSVTGGFAGGSGPYDSAGNLWLEGALYRKVGNEHAYYDPTQPTAAVVVPPDQVMNFDGKDFDGSPAAIQVGNAVYWLTRPILERAVAPSGPTGPWTVDASYKVTLGTAKLPAERGTCSVSGALCGKTADCGPGGGVCRFVCQSCGPILCNLTGSVCDDQGTACPAGQQCLDPSGAMWKHDVSSGGSPASLWMLLDYTFASATYLGRVPLSVPLPDGAATSRPAIAWNGGDCASHPRQCRLWLAAQKDGRLKYRVRDDGFWSGWFDVTPQAPATVTGGAAVVAAGTTVSALARSPGGIVHWSLLTSPTTCNPGVDCNWTGWSPLPSTLTTQHDVAATIHGTAFVAVRNAADGKVWYTRGLQGAFGWEPWAVINGLTTDAAPSVVSDSGRVAVAAREAGTGAIKVAYVVDGSGPTAWSEPGAASSLKPWGTAPAIVRRTGQLQLYAARSGSPEHVYVVASTGGPWGSWRRLPSRSTATQQPAAADVNGDTNLVTADAAGLAEEAAQ